MGTENKFSILCRLARISVEVLITAAIDLLFVIASYFAPYLFILPSHKLNIQEESAMHAILVGFPYNVFSCWLFF